MRWRELRTIGGLMLLAWATLARGGGDGDPPTPRPGPRPAPLSRAVAVEPAGSSPLSRDGETVVDPGATFEVELSARLPDARVVLLDGADAHVACRGTQELGVTTRLALSPEAPLAAGARYVLRVEGTTSRELRDGERAFDPATFTLLVAGTPPAPAPKAKPKKGRRRR